SSAGRRPSRLPGHGAPQPGGPARRLDRYDASAGRWHRAGKRRGRTGSGPDRPGGCAVGAAGDQRPRASGGPGDGDHAAATDTVTAAPGETATPGEEPTTGTETATATATDAPEDFLAVDEVSTGDQTGDPDLLVTGVRLGAHEAFDRVVLDLEGSGTPGWRV